MNVIEAYGNEIGNDKSVVFLCKTPFGRFLYNLTLFFKVPAFLGFFLRTPFSRPQINKFIKKHGIDMTPFKGRKFSSFNDFFTRKDESRTVDMQENHLISPSDSALSIYKIEENSTFHIKGFDYTLRDFFESEDYVSTFAGGDCLIFRLAATDYHRYCYIDDGSLEKNHYIEGKLYSVQPICAQTFKIYTKNRRSWTILDTKNFGRVAQIEVGAFSVGGIKNHHENYTFKKGEEKGYFDLHGSTIVMLFEKGKIEVDKKIQESTAGGKEYKVRYGECIGKKAIFN